MECSSVKLCQIFIHNEANQVSRGASSIHHAVIRCWGLVMYLDVLVGRVSGCMVGVLGMQKGKRGRRGERGGEIGSCKVRYLKNQTL